ncbi:MAG TPA: NADH-quinone oxidoreductase subunit K [Elusimicrobiales bacterium]|nr:NADH-quinone oxidoreductase subunit K [Elusimicrobiales bacterium]HPO94402.1 NADH-quinone oxidoreductase subunit K [Elusimicrobiales bacterium]
MIYNFPIDWFFISILFFIGAYCMVVSKNIIKLLIGFEIISKSALIAVITAGLATNNINLAQNIIIVMILVEAVVIASGLALVVKYYRLNQSIDITKTINLKG